MRRLPAALLALVLVVAMAGCSEGGGVSSGAEVSAYVAAPLCAAARRELSRQGGRAGDLRVRAVCLAPVEAGGRLDLAAAGANARRASEDSAAVAYLEPPGRATRFADPILESAGIPAVVSTSGATAMHRTLEAISAADPNSLRSSVGDSLNR